MIKKAHATFPGGKWVLADATDWRSDDKYDLVFSNATLQWISDHEKLLRQLFDRINGNGALAAQVPFNIESPLYKALIAVSESSKWHNLMIGCSDQIFYRDEAYYYSLLSKLSTRVEMWMTTYFHIMETHQNLVDWYASTGMKMYLERIETEEKKRQFKAEILEACKPQYPFQPDGKILFPFQRLFFIAYKAAET
jgi:trans-aconitate 2-methyltransferase